MANDLGPGFCLKCGEPFTTTLALDTHQLGTGHEMDQPDHPIRLKAADQFFKLVDLYPPKQPEPVSDGRPIAVTIVLTGADPRAELQAHGVRLHLSSNGDDSA